MHLTVTSFLVRILDSNWCDDYYYFKALYNSGMDTNAVNDDTGENNDIWSKGGIASGESDQEESQMKDHELN